MIPMALALWFSLTDFDLRRPDEVRFVGLDNYIRMFSDPHVVAVDRRHAAVRRADRARDDRRCRSGLAILLNSPRLVGRRGFRTLFYMPTQIPLVASTLIWAGVLNAETGWMNGILGVFGVTGPDWLQDPFWVLPSLGVIGLWGIGAMMLISLAGLQSIPTELYDAAKVDGAGHWTTFRRITLPLAQPGAVLQPADQRGRRLAVLHPGLRAQERATRTTRRCSSTSTSTAKPSRSTSSATRPRSRGCCSCIVLGLALLLFWSSSRWVFYAGERR